jgi:hypothetical protein
MRITTDYLVIGAGASGLAPADVDVLLAGPTTPRAVPECTRIPSWCFTSLGVSYATRTWMDAYESLSRADERAPLAAVDLELLATSAYMLDLNDE